MSNTAFAKIRAVSLEREESRQHCFARVRKAAEETCDLFTALRELVQGTRNALTVVEIEAVKDDLFISLPGAYRYWRCEDRDVFSAAMHVTRHFLAEIRTSIADQYLQEIAALLKCQLGHTDSDIAVQDSVPDALWDIEEENRRYSVLAAGFIDILWRLAREYPGSVLEHGRAPGQAAAPVHSLDDAGGLWTTEQAAKYLNMTPRAVRSGVRAGIIAGHKYPPGSRRGQLRFRKEELEAGFKGKRRKQPTKGVSDIYA